MGSKKAFAGRALSVLGLLPVISGFRSRYISELMILAYHRIVDVADDAEYKFDLDLISASSEDFEWQMTFVKKHYNPITFFDLVEITAGRKKMPLRPLIVTFDDGFDDNYSIAFPILKKCNVPATIFISTDYIGGTKTFWFDWVAHIILCADNIIIDLNSADLVLDLNSDRKQRKLLLKTLLRRLKEIPNSARINAIEMLEHQTGFVQNKEKFFQSAPLTWEQVKEMSASNIEFGSHSVTHPIFSNLDDDELYYEIEHSKNVLEDQLAKPCQVLAYPVGGKNAFDKRALKMAEQCGYEFSTSYVNGTNSFVCYEKHALKRLHVERYQSREEFAAMLSLPSIFM